MTTRIAPKQASTQELQQAIERIQGVISARVILDASHEILEVHIVATTERHPKRIVRDVESLLCARYGIRVDYRKISLVQLDVPERDAGDHRLRFISAIPTPAAGDGVEVTLQASRERYVGSAAVCPKDSHQPAAYAAASATLRAVQEAIGQTIPLAVQGIEIVQTENHQVCLAVVSAMTARGPECLAGTCIVGGDLLEAASKAALDAINRRIPIWITTGRGMAQDVGSTPLAPSQAR